MRTAQSRSSRHRRRHRARRRHRLRRRLRHRRRRQQRLAQDAHLLGLQPGPQHRGRQEDPHARAEQVREADRHQGQARGRPLVRPAQPDPRRHHLRAGPRRAQHRQHLVRLAPGHRRAAALGRRRTSTRSAARTASSTRRVARPAPRARTRPPSRCTRWRTRSTTTRRCSPRPASRSRRPPGTSWSRTARSSPRTASGRWAPRAPTSPNNIHQVFVLGQAARRRLLRRRRQARPSPPTARSPRVKQYVDLMAKDKIVAPGNAEYAQNQSLQDFANGKTAMVLWQAAAADLRRPGHEARRLGRRPGAGPGRRARHRQAAPTPWSPASTWPSSRTPRTSTAP